MKRHQWAAIIADIEKNLEDDGYALNILLRSGATYPDVTWQPLGGLTDTIILSGGDEPPAYVDVEQIAAVELAS